jgi:hypothetical protein
MKQNNTSMSFGTLCKIWDNQQKESAKSAILPKDRARKSLTRKEQLTKYAQLGKRIRYGNIIFTFDYDLAMGKLITPEQIILGATISDFINAVNHIAGIE